MHGGIWVSPLSVSLSLSLALALSLSLSRSLSLSLPLSLSLWLLHAHSVDYECFEALKFGGWMFPDPHIWEVKVSGPSNLWGECFGTFKFGG